MTFSPCSHDTSALVGAASLEPATRETSDNVDVELMLVDPFSARL
jgi:hypothetical protein